MLFLSSYVKHEESPNFFFFDTISCQSRYQVIYSAVGSLNLHDASQNLVRKYLDKNNVHPKRATLIIAGPRYQFGNGQFLRSHDS